LASSEAPFNKIQEKQYQDRESHCVSFSAFVNIKIPDSTSANQKPLFPWSVVVEPILRDRDQTETVSG